jgi:hypothetical protein
LRKANYGRDGKCKRCCAAYQRDYYRKNKDKFAAWVKKSKAKLKAAFYAWKRQFKCSRCPESHPACLDFHHRDPAKKEYYIVQMWMRGYSMERIKAEAAKCDVLCANCHRKHHWANGHVQHVKRKFKNT